MKKDLASNFCYFLVQAEGLVLIEGNWFYGGQLFHFCYPYAGYLFCILAFQFINGCKQGCPPGSIKEGSLVSFSQNQVKIQIAGPFLFIHYFRPFYNGSPGRCMPRESF